MRKTFPGALALRGVDLRLERGEVLALMGENGAGKSTLMKILGGACAADSGVISINGEPVTIRGPADAQRAGVAMIHQEFHLVPGLSAAENIFLGRERTRAGFLRGAQEERLAREIFHRLGAPLDPRTPCGRLSVAEQQLVEIAKALSLDARILVMDEPSAALTPREVERLFAIVAELKARGIGIIYISHRLDEIFRIADRVMVMRDGAGVGDQPTAGLDRQRLIELMVGRTLDQEFPKRAANLGPVRLQARHLSRGAKVRDVSFAVRAGEVLGITGLAGAGRTELARLVFGADRAEAGSIERDGQPVRIRSPRDAIRHGIALLTEDRKGQGLVLDLSVRENFALPNLARFSTAGFIRGGMERADLGHYTALLRIKAGGSDQPVANLSGGNQQKVVLAKWLERNCEVLIIDEPTRGIDVGAKHEIYLLINQLAAQGKAIILISSELPEILGMADRILVIREGRVAGEINDVAAATQEAIMKLAVA